MNVNSFHDMSMGSNRIVPAGGDGARQPRK
jgi:hypothetical protein